MIFSRGDATALPTLLRNVELMAKGLWLMDLEFTHDILCRRVAHDNRRSRRSRWFFSIQNSFLAKQILQQIDGPTARHFGVFRVFCG